jgi:hypothetical protein
MSQDVVDIEAALSEMQGYGKDGKLKNAFYFPTTPATASGIDLMRSE